mgnify:CR=1 FL=1
MVRADAEEPDRPSRIEGYAAVFGAESVDLGGFREVIHRGAFANTLGSADVRGLINPDPNLVLGRTTAGTLELREDERGLAFTLYPPDTAAARDLLVSMERGDVDQMSFGFETVRDRWETDDRGALRHLLEAQLFDVSVVTFPAYPQTSAEARAMARDMDSASSSGERIGNDEIHDGEPEEDLEDGADAGEPGEGDGATEGADSSDSAESAESGKPRVRRRMWARLELESRLCDG